MTGNTVTLFGEGSTEVSIATTADMAEALKGASAEGSRGLPDGGVYVSFSGKRGKYSIGEKGDDADPNELWLVNVHGFERGYICWKGGSPVAKRFDSIYRAPIPAPDRNEHGPFATDRGEGWFSAKAIVIKSLDRGIAGYFQTNTKSALSEFSSLEGQVADRMAAQEPCWPVIQLSMEEFTAQGQKNYKPKFIVYGWLGAAQIQKMAGMTSIEAVAESIDALLDEAEKGGPEPVAAEAEPAEEPVVDTDTDPAPWEEEPAKEEPAKARSRSAARPRRRATV